MGNKASKQRSAAHHRTRQSTRLTPQLVQGRWQASLPLQRPIPQLRMEPVPSTAALVARCTRSLTRCARQVKQLIKMGALAPRYPGVSDADEQFNDECPICFFRHDGARGSCMRLTRDAATLLSIAAIAVASFFAPSEPICRAHLLGPPPVPTPPPFCLQMLPSASEIR
jgi:hypothetical protein